MNKVLSILLGVGYLIFSIWIAATGVIQNYSQPSLDNLADLVNLSIYLLALLYWGPAIIGSIGLLLNKNWGIWVIVIHSATGFGSSLLDFNFRDPYIYGFAVAFLMGMILLLGPKAALNQPTERA